jgi:hypothetical protein
MKTKWNLLDVGFCEVTAPRFLQKFYNSKILT